MEPTLSYHNYQVPEAQPISLPDDDFSFEVFEDSSQLFDATNCDVIDLDEKYAIEPCPGNPNKFIPKRTIKEPTESKNNTDSLITKAANATKSLIHKPPDKTKSPIHKPTNKTKSFKNNTLKSIRKCRFTPVSKTMRFLMPKQAPNVPDVLTVSKNVEPEQIQPVPEPEGELIIKSKENVVKTTVESVTISDDECVGMVIDEDIDTSDTDKEDQMKKDSDDKEKEEKKSSAINEIVPLIRSTSEKFTCELCPFTTNVEKYLEFHKNRHEQQLTRLHSCRKCHETFVKKLHLTLHKANCPFYSKFLKICPHCPYKTVKNRYFNFHLQSHENQKLMKCLQCSFETTLGIKVFRMHMKEHPKLIPPKRKENEQEADTTKTRKEESGQEKIAREEAHQKKKEHGQGDKVVEAQELKIFEEKNEKR